MAMSRTSMRNQISKGGKKKIKKIANALNKASRKHAGQARKLRGMISGRNQYTKITDSF